MAITQTLASSFNSELLTAQHNLVADTLKIALYSSAATLNAATTAYTTANEIAATGGYVAGGKTITGAAVALDGSTAVVDFDDVIWSGATITARGALIYNASNSNKAIAVLDFGGDKTSTSGNFSLVIPPATAGSAIIQVG